MGGAHRRPAANTYKSAVRPLGLLAYPPTHGVERAIIAIPTVVRRTMHSAARAGIFMRGRVGIDIGVWALLRGAPAVSATRGTKAR